MKNNGSGCFLAVFLLFFAAGFVWTADRVNLWPVLYRAAQSPLAPWVVLVFVLLTLRWMLRPESRS